MQLGPFKPHPLIRGGYLQTVGGQLFATPKLPTGFTEELIDLPDGDKLLLHIDRPASPDARKPLVLLLHGLTGSSESTYILRITAKLTRLGYEVVRFNHRGAGRGAERLARSIYHAGRMPDLHAALRHLAATRRDRPVLVAGFSLSGNMLLRYLGEHRDVEPNVIAALSVCAPIDLASCAAALAAPRNKPIDLYYTRRLMRTAATRAEWFPELQRPAWPRRMNLALFDELYTAPQAGFANANAYYAFASAKPLLGSIVVPTTILVAADDPVVPVGAYHDAQLSPSITLRVEASGGHMGFITARRTGFGDRRWLDAAVVDWVRNK